MTHGINLLTLIIAYAILIVTVLAVSASDLQEMLFRVP